MCPNHMMDCCPNLHFSLRSRMPYLCSLEEGQEIVVVLLPFAVHHEVVLDLDDPLQDKGHGIVTFTGGQRCSHDQGFEAIDALL